MLRDERRVFDERSEVTVDEPPKLEVDEQLIHRGVADALADAERAAVYPVGKRGRGERVDRAESAVVVSVEVHLHIPAAHDLVPDEGQQVAYALRRRMAAGIGDADALRAGRDGSFVEPRERLGVGPRGVLGDEHHREARLHQGSHACLDALQHRVELPILGKAADWRRADERAGFDRHAGLSRGLDRAAHVIGMGADGTVRTEMLQLRRFLRERDDRGARLG